MSDVMTDLAMNDGMLIADSTGDLMIFSDRDSIIQDIRNELTSFDGDVFDAEDGEYGYGLPEFINLEATEINQLELEQRIKSKLAANEYLDQEETDVQIISWDMNGIRLEIPIQLQGEDIRLQIFIAKGLIDVEEV